MTSLFLYPYIMNCSSFILLIKTFLYSYSVATESADSNFETANIVNGARSASEYIAKVKNKEAK